MLSRQAVKEARQAEHGRHIYAYCNVRTKQVLYSLDRTLRPSALKQLPDIGANNTPPTLRKDSWRPLFSVELPDTPDGRQQGLGAFQMLREYRALHETEWEPPLELSLRLTQRGREKLQQRLDNRGGSKKEYVHDLIKRKKKNLRKNIIMNQKANSIADLAAVLLHQEERSKLLRRQREVDTELARKKETEEILKLAEEAKQGKIEQLKERRQQLLEDIQERRVPGRINKTKMECQAMGREIEKIQYAAAAVEWVELPKARREQEIAYWELQTQIGDSGIPGHSRFSQDRQLEGCDAIQTAVMARASGIELALPKTQPPQPEPRIPQMKPATSEQDSTDTTSQAGSPAEPVDTTQLLPSFPPKFNPLSTPLDKVPKKDKQLLKAIKQKNAPLYSNKGVTVRWANILDAEHAELWPEEVQHERMGIVRNTHPKMITDEPIEDISVFKAVNWRTRKQHWELEPESAEDMPDTWQRVQEIRAQMGMVEDPLNGKKFIEENKLNPFFRTRLEAARRSQAIGMESDDSHDSLEGPGQDPSAKAPSTGEPALGEQKAGRQSIIDPAVEGLTAEEPTVETPEEMRELSAEEQVAVLQVAAAERQEFLQSLAWQSRRSQWARKEQQPAGDPSQQIAVPLDQPPTPTDQRPTA